MKILDLIKLGHAHIYVHKKQSFLTVLTTGILFGVLLGIIFLFNGLENLFIRASESLGGETIYVYSSSCPNGGNCREYQTVESLARTKAATYNGVVDGKLEVYEYKNGGATFRVIGKKYVKNLIEIDMGSYESGTLFKLISLDRAEELLESETETPENTEDMSYVSGNKVYSLSEINDLKSRVLGREFVETYSVPTTPPETEEIEEGGDEAVEEVIAETSYETKEIRYVVAGVVGTTRTSLSLATKYGDMKLLDLFLKQVAPNVSATDGLFVSSETGSINFREVFDASEADFSFPITKFENFSDAYNYYINENCTIERNLGKCSSYTVTELIGNRLQTKDALDSLFLALNYGEIMLLLIAVSISVFTFVRLISENARSIALYRSLGASSFDILFIHLSYLIELCLITILFAVILGADLATLISLKDAESLSNILTSLYSRKIESGVLIGFSSEVTKIILAILLTAPLCSLLTLDQLSTKNIAKKIKE